MDFKLLGGILLIVGTSIGAGMLALPLVMAQSGFVGSLILLLLCWLFMLAGAFLLLEINLLMPLNSNLNTMARSTIGPLGQIISWLTFLSLLYSLLCAYISGGSDLMRNILALSNIHLTEQRAALLFTIVFGLVVYLGIKTIDYTNRILMLLKFTVFFFLIFLLIPYATPQNLSTFLPRGLISQSAIMVTITSFGYSAIIPSLRAYFANDIKKLRWAIIIGSLIPLVCYIAWDAAIMGVIPIHGKQGLLAILTSQRSTSDLVQALANVSVAETTIDFFARVFTSICVLTSFLGVALCLTDFWADCLQVNKQGLNNVIVHLLTFVPPLLIVLFYPGIFVRALEYAGIYCVILLALLPAVMVWFGRYHKKMISRYRVIGGKPMLWLIMFLSIILIGYSLIV